MSGFRGLALALSLLFRNSSPKAKLAGPSTIDQPLTPEDFEAHVAGDRRFGAIPFVDNEHIYWACIDLDVKNYEEFDDPDDPGVFSMIDSIVEGLALRGIRALLELSKSKGWHLWVYFDRPVRARDARQLLRRIALKAGARDESDLVCPRQDRLEEDRVGNGTFLPLYGGDQPPHTRFFECDPDTTDWVEAANQDGFLREFIDNPSPAGAVPPAPDEAPAATPDGHPCAWILDELHEEGVELKGLVYAKDKIQFECPIHVAKHPRQRGGSAVIWSDGHGHCSSSKCERKWQTVAQLLDLLGAKRQMPRLRVLTPEEFEQDRAPEALVEGMIYEASTTTLNGASKAGKTYAALQLGMAVATGEPFLGLKTTRARVLYLSFELSAAMVRARMREIAASTGVTHPRIGEDFLIVAPTADYLPQLDLASPEGPEELERLVRETGAELVIFDTLYRFLPNTDPNCNQEMGKVCGRMNDFTHRTGSASLALDHVSKGEQLGPVSHSGLGASVKGGAARVVIALKRTTKEDGGRWSLDVESHFGSWDEPLHYERPKLLAGSRGAGCVLCTASQAHGLDFGAVEALFIDHGDRDHCGRPLFPSKRSLIEALKAAKHASGNQDGAEQVKAIIRDYCAPENAVGPWKDERPIVTSDGPRNAMVFTWRMVSNE